MQWNCEGPEIAESAVSFDMLRYSNSYLLALPPSFSRQNIN